MNVASLAHMDPEFLAHSMSAGMSIADEREVARCITPLRQQAQQFLARRRARGAYSSSRLPEPLQNAIGEFVYYLGRDRGLRPATSEGRPRACRAGLVSPGWRKPPARRCPLEQPRS